MPKYKVCPECGDKVLAEMREMCDACNVPYVAEGAKKKPAAKKVVKKKPRKA